MVSNIIAEIRRSLIVSFAIRHSDMDILALKNKYIYVRLQC